MPTPQNSSIFTRILGVIGKVCIFAGLILIAFSGYQLWGTGIAERQAQNSLEKTFEARRAPTPQFVIPKYGEVAGKLSIESIGLSKMIVVGVDYKNLEKGPGIFPGSPLPGHPGNLAIAGHRNTFGAPFEKLNEVQEGDKIEVTTAEGTFTYIAYGDPTIVPATAVEVATTVDPTRTTLTLITCHPKWTSTNRLIVTAEIVAAVPPLQAAVFAIPEDIAPLNQGWFHDVSTWPAIVALFIALTVIVFGTPRLVRRYHRPWLLYPLAAVVFLPTLFVFFTQITRILPSNL